MLILMRLQDGSYVTRVPSQTCFDIVIRATEYFLLFSKHSSSPLLLVLKGLH